MQDRVAASHMDGMLHDLPHILLVAYMHQAARRKPVLAQNLEEDFDSRFAERTGNFAYSPARVGSQGRFGGGTDLCVNARYEYWASVV